jgi:hypothetical protein
MYWLSLVVLLLAALLKKILPLETNPRGVDGQEEKRTVGGKKRERTQKRNKAQCAKR